MATSVRLDPDIEKRLDLLARRTGRTKAYYLRELIEGGIGEMEEYYLATEVRERVRKGQEELLSSDQVKEELGLAD